MARRPRLFAPGLLYHVIVRGNQRQKTFLGERDYKAYLERLAKYRAKFAVTLYAYCLMPNHVHLLLESSEEPLAKFMQSLQQSYTQYFNRLHRKVGHLFQGRYKAIVCERDEYLLALIRYIHLNPVRAGLVKRPEQYRYSAHRVYLEGRATEVLDPAKLLRLLGGRSGYRSFVEQEIGQGHRQEYYEVEDQRFLGAEGFGEKLTREVEGEKRRGVRKSLSHAVRELAAKLDVSLEALRGPDRGWSVSRKRTLLVYTLVRRLGFGVSEVAAYMGRDVSTLSSVISRLSGRMRTEEQVRKEAERLA